MRFRSTANPRLRSVGGLVLALALGALWSCEMLINNYVKLDTTSVPDGTVTQPYSTNIHASIQNFVDDNRYDFIFSVSDGNLPTGLVLTSNENVATISGTPSVAGAYTFQIQVFSPRLYSEIASRSRSDDGETTSSDLANNSALNRAADAHTYKLTINPTATP